jgi:hypothetical protein
MVNSRGLGTERASWSPFKERAASKVEEYFGAGATFLKGEYSTRPVHVGTALSSSAASRL